MIMKKALQSKKVLDSISQINEPEKAFRSILANLEKVQKALLDYLEKQRQAFPRFYFIGDEDLLEIIGNSKDVGGVQNYFSKMFAGISFVQSENGGTLLTALRS